MIRMHNPRFGTTPCAVHHNGQKKYNVTGWEINSQYFDMLKDHKVDKSHLKDITLVTWNSFYPTKGSLERSCDHFGIPYHVLGQGVNPFVHYFKIKMLLDFLPYVKTEYIFCADSSDVFLTSDIYNIIPRFHRYKAGLVFQGEAWSYPPNEQCRQFDHGVEGSDTTPYLHLNSGLWFGYTSYLNAIASHLEAMEPIKPPDDQGVYRRLYMKLCPQIRLDFHCHMFQSTAGMEYLKMELNLEKS